MITEVCAQLGYRVSDARQLSQRVWVAWHTETRCWHCLKLAESAEHRYGIRREAHWLQRLHSSAYSSCAAYLGHYQLGGCEVLVTSRVSARPLSEMLRQNTEFHPEFRNKLYLSLQQLHRLGICHGDIKPANILVLNDEPVLVDFASASEPGIAVAELPYRSFSPSYSLPALQRGEGAVDVLHDWYGFMVILSLVNNRTLLQPEWSDSESLVNTVNILLSGTDGLTTAARHFLAQQIQRLPDFS